MFSKHHYLDASHHKGADVYVGIVNDQVVSFISVMHTPHPISKNLKRVHRLVVLPEYQGLGIGYVILTSVAKHYLEKDFRFTIATSHPGLIRSLKSKKHWKCLSFGRMSSVGKTGNKFMRNTNSSNRITASFEYLEV